MKKILPLLVLMLGLTACGSAGQKDSYEQISILEDPHKKEQRDKVQNVLDKINKKYGRDIIKSAILFNEND